MQKDYTIYGIASVALAVAIIGVLFQQVQLQKEIANREEMGRLVLARTPDVQSLPPIMRETTESFWVTIPIINKSTSSSAGAHRIQVSITFGKDNMIRKIDADPFVVVDGWQGGHSANLELSVLYPQSVIYTSFLVNKSETPQVVIGWAEKTAIQTMPLVDSP